MSMTIADLKAAIADLPDDYQVVMSKDAEGNRFSPLEEIGPGWYEPDSTYSGDFDTEGGLMNSYCLWPTN